METTTIAEGMACVLGLGLYAAFSGILLTLAIPISLDAFVADPFSAWFNNKMKLRLKPKQHQRIIGFCMCSVGMISLLKALTLIG